MKRAALVASAALACVAGCAPRLGVLRAVDGAYVLGEAYEPDAYAYMLAGVLAEGDGQLEAAATAYERARDSAPHDAEIAARLYRASCFAAPAGAFDESSARGKWLEPALDAGYAPAYAALADCVQRQGTHGDAKQLARAKEGLARTARDPDLSARSDAAGNAAQTELRLSVLVTAHPESREAHLALAQVLERTGKRLAAAEEYAAYARTQPSARKDMLRKAESFGTRGEVYGARRIAGAALDAPSLEGAPLGELPAQGARYGVDEALLRGDDRAALRRASRGRVPLGEVAARALLAGDRALGERLAHAVVGSADGKADPDAVAVLLALGETAPAALGTPSEAGRRLVERITAP